MRVEVAFELEDTCDKLEIPWGSDDPEAGYLDLRENAALIGRIEPAREYLPLRGFLSAVNSADSMFSSARCKTWASQAGAGASSEPERCEFSSRVDLVFAAEQLNLDRSRYENLTARLQELLARDASPDTQRAELRVRLCRFRAQGRWGFCLAVILHGRGATPEQAQLRWGLGLARMQQALLFVSRVLRQQFSQAS